MLKHILTKLTKYLFLGNLYNNMGKFNEAV